MHDPDLSDTSDGCYRPFTNMIRVIIAGGFADDFAVIVGHTATPTVEVDSLYHTQPQHQLAELIQRESCIIIPTTNRSY